jgi:hypothetical protein
MLGMIKRKYKKIQNIVTSFLLSHLLVNRFDEEKVFILTSSPRSGSTLLGQILDEIPESCSLFEPLQLTHVPEAEKAGFSWRTYVSPKSQWQSGYDFFSKIFQGRVINRWTAMEMTFFKSLAAKRMVIKFVRANRILPWLCQNFALHPPVLLLRHPCAVVASQLNYDYAWNNIERPEVPEYIQDYPKFVEIIENANSELEYLTIMWVLDQLPVLLSSAPNPWLIVTYEELILRPEETINLIADKWQVNIDMEKALLKLKKPSMVVSTSGISGINGWQRKLTKEQISTILSIVHAFGLFFYDCEEDALYHKLNSDELAKMIKESGT